MFIENKEIITYGVPYVIAEIGNNHQGNLELALKMIKIAKEYCKVDAVKFQKRSNKTLFTKEFYNREYLGKNSYGTTYGEHREFLEFGEMEYNKIYKYCKELQVDLIVTPFDEESLDFLENYDLSAYKIASSDLTNIPLIKKIARTNKPIILSTGASTMSDIKMAYETIINYNNNVALLHCVTKYPPEENELNLRVINTLKENFNDVVVGYSGHELGIKASLMAYSMGGTIIEKHFTLDKTQKGTDHKISLDPEELKKLVEELNNAYKILGDGNKILSNDEIQARNKLGKSIYATKRIIKGEKLSEQNICIKSPAGFTSPQKYYEILGKITNKEILEDMPILLEDLKEENE